MCYSLLVHRVLKFPVGLKLSIQKIKIMASSPITSWQIDGEAMEIETLFWGAPKSQQMVTAAMKFRHLLLGRKAMVNLDSILWSRDINVPTKVHLVKAREKEMAIHSSTLAWKIPWMEEPGRLQSIRSRRVGHDWVTSLSLFTFMHWRRKWQPTLVFLPGESQGRGSLVGCRLWGHTELDTTEVT